MSVMGIFPFCFYGTTLTADLQMIGLSGYELPWYLLPRWQQRNVIFVIKYGQIQRSVEGFGIMKCNLETFLRVDSSILQLFIFHNNFECF